MAENTHNSAPSLIRRLFLRFDIQLPDRPTTPPSHQPAKNILLEIGALIGLAVLFHFSIADIIIACYALLVFALKILLLVSKKRITTPPQVIIIVLTILSVGLIILLYGGWNGQRAGISFLVLLVTLKFLESRTLRDYYVVCLILYFLAASSFLFNSSILSISLVLVYTLAITIAMLKLSSPIAVERKLSALSAVSIVSKALPLALILFFFFPRIHGSFGFIPSQDELNNELNNSLVAGDLASSAFNNKLAFRVEFEGTKPDNNELYWRSKVMPVEENFTWSVRPPTPNELSIAGTKKNALNDLNKQDKSQKSLFRYSILHEKSSDLFIPYLDYVVTFSRGRFLNDFSIWQRRAQTGAFTYQGSSLLKLSIPEDSQINTNDLLRTVSQPTARIQTLLATWRQNTSDPIELAQQVLNHFTTNEFYYSLYPPGLDDQQPLDDFIFNSQTGYCEHYASAFTILMRWLGVPARVVAGYQGGRENQTGEFVEVRYSDAHAWSEILVNNKWVRVDPTASINPERIEFGMEAFMSLWGSDDANGYLGSAGLSNYLNPTGVDRYYRLLRDNWSNLSYQWNKWVINYDAETQQELLSKLGIEGRNRYGSLVLIMFGSIGILLLFYFWRLLPSRIQHDNAQRYYLKFTNRFKRKGLIKAPADTPYDFAIKAISQFPNQSHEINELTDAYVQLRYGKESYSLNKFKQLVKRFKLRTK